MSRSAMMFMLAGFLALALPAAAQTYLELGAPPVRDAVPPDCSDWHELYPNFCVIHHQDLYEDNGDGVVSPCDFIVLNGVRYHIDWVGPTYYLVELTTGEPKFCEPTILTPGGDPTCEVWHEIAPAFCMEWHIDAWEDNGDDVLSECDNILLGGRWWHIDEIRLDITVTEAPNPVDESTWSQIKEFFQRLRNLF